MILLKFRLWNLWGIGQVTGKKLLVLVRMTEAKMKAADKWTGGWTHCASSTVWQKMSGKQGLKSGLGMSSSCWLHERRDYQGKQRERKKPARGRAGWRERKRGPIWLNGQIFIVRNLDKIQMHLKTMNVGNEITCEKLRHFFLSV